MIKRRLKDTASFCALISVYNSVLVCAPVVRSVWLWFGSGLLGFRCIRLDQKKMIVVSAVCDVMMWDILLIWYRP